MSTAWPCSRCYCTRRTPARPLRPARRDGALATVHPVDLLGTVQRAVIERSGIDPALVGQIIGGCVSQVGEQTFNIARGAWLSAGLPLEVAASSVDSQC